MKNKMYIAPAVDVRILNTRDMMAASSKSDKPIGMAPAHRTPTF